MTGNSIPHLSASPRPTPHTHTKFAGAEYKTGHAFNWTREFTNCLYFRGVILYRVVTDSLPFTTDGRSYSQLYSVILRGYDVPTYLSPGQLVKYTPLLFTLFTKRIWADRPEQTVLTLIRRRKTRRLIRVYTACHSSDSLSTSAHNKME